MAGDIGDLFISFDIRGNIEEKIGNYTKKLKGLNEEVKKARENYEAATNELGKLSKGTEEWNKQKDSVIKAIHAYDDVIKKVNIYTEVVKKAKTELDKLNSGNLVTGGTKITTLLDTKPIEEQIAKYEKLISLVKKLPDLEERKPRDYMEFLWSDRAGSKGLRAYNAAQDAYRSQLSSIKQQIKDLGGEGKTLKQLETELSSLYSTLIRFSNANDNVDRTSKRHVITQREVETAFKDLVAAERRAEEQEKANKASIEATNKARQKQVETLRSKSESLNVSKLRELERQRSALASAYSSGKKLGMDDSELANIARAYREISREVLRLQTLLQNPKSYSYGELFESGRFMGPGASYVSDAAEKLGDIKQKMYETRMQMYETSNASRDLASSFSRIHSSASGMSSTLRDIKTLFLQGGIVFGAKQFADSIIQTGGEIVQQHIAMRTLIGDVQKADAMFAKTKDLALQSPFKFGELNRDVKQLAAFGVDTDRLYDTTKRLADVSSGLGVSFERLGLAYGQVKARSWLDAKELRQFAYAGLPMLQKIADYYNDIKKNGKNSYSTADIRKMITKREVSFEDVDQVFQRLTNEGGQFYNMQFVLSETLLGKWNKLIDAWDIMLSKFAEGNNAIGGFFSKGIDLATKFVLSLDKLSPILLSLGTVFGGKKLLGFLGGKMGFDGGKISNEFAKAQEEARKLYIVRQMQKVTEGNITKEQALQNIQSRKELLNSQAVKDATVMQMYAEGRLKVTELGALASKRQISAELIKQMRSLDLITAKEERLLMTIREEGVSRKGVTAQMQLAGGEATGKLGGLFSKGNLAMLGIATAMGLYSSYQQFSEDMEQRADSIAESSKQRAKDLKEVYDRISEKGNKEPLSDRIEAMKGVLQKSDMFTNSIRDQIAHAKSLNEQYSILKGKIKEAYEQQKNQEDEKDIVEQALKASKITPLAPQFMNKKQSGDFWSRITDETFINTIFGSSIDDRVKKYNEIAKALERAKAAGRDTAREHEKLSNVWDKMVNSNLARILQSIRISLKVNASAFSTWSNTVKNSFNNALLGVLNSLENADDILKARLYAYAKIATMHPNWDLSDPKVNAERGRHPVAIWMRYYLDHYASNKNDIQNSFSGDDGTKKNKNKGSQKDTELERIRNRVELYKKFYSEWKKYAKIMGDEGALDMLRKSSDFSPVFGWSLKDVTDFSNSLDQLTSSLKRTSEERRKFINDTNADKATKRREDMEQGIKNDINDLNSELKTMEETYNNIYLKIVKSTGNIELANKIAFGGAIGYADSVNSPQKLLRRQMSRQFGNDKGKADIVLGMDREQISKNYGLDSPIGKIWQNNQDNNIKLLKEADQLYVDIITKHQTIQDSIDAENATYKSQLELLEKRKKDLGDDLYNKQKQSLTETHNQKIGDYEFKQYKQDKGWEQIFRDLDRISNTTINNLLKGLRDFLSTHDMSEENVKTITEAMDRLMTKKESSSPFSSIADGFGDLSLLREIRSRGTNKNGNYIMSAEEAAHFGLKRSKTDEYSSSDLDSAQDSIFKGFENSVKGVQQAFEGLQSVLTPVEELFDAMGSHEMSQVAGAGSKAFGAAASTASGLNSLRDLAGKDTGFGKMLGNLGPYGAAAAAALSVATSIIGGKSASQKAYEKQAEYLKNIQGTVKDINNNLKNKVSSSYGSEAQKAGRKIDENLKMEADQVRSTYYSWSQAKNHKWGNRNRVKTNLDFDQINAYLRQIGYNGPAVDGETIQNLSGEYLEQIKERYHGMWSNIPKEARDLLDRIIEIEKETGEIEDNTNAITKAVTDMDLDSIKSEWADMLNDLDSDNQDFSKSFENHLRKAIISGMIANLYAQKIKGLTESVKKAGGTEAGNKYVDKNGNIKEHTGGDDSADVASEYTSEEYQKAQNDYVSLASQAKETAKMFSRIYGWSDNSNSKAGNSIKGITEEEAGIIASLLQAIRLDTSVNRVNIQKIADALDGMSDLSSVAESQLAELRLISSNTLRNAEAAEKIQSLLESITTPGGIKKVNIN